MWWRDDQDEWVSEYVYRLLGAWREGELRFVTVIGSTWTENGDRTLFVGVDPDLDPRSRAWAPGIGPLHGVARRLIRRYGPLPYPTRPFVGGFATDEARRRLARPLGAIRAIGLLLAIHVGLVRPSPFDLMMVPLDAADELTRFELRRFEVPPETQIGYLGTIRPASARGNAVHRRASREHATVGCLVATDRGPLLTTAGHLGAVDGEIVYREKARAWRRHGPAWGRIVAVTSPARPDRTSTFSPGLDLAAIDESGEAPAGRWQRVNVGDPRALRRGEYFFWTGAQTGFHEADLTITAAMAEADNDVPYEHALMATGRPPKRAGRDGDSGSAVYDREGRLIGHFVGTEGGRERGTAPNGWIQMVDLAHDYLEDRFGPIRGYYGDPPR